MWKTHNPGPEPHNRLQKFWRNIGSSVITVAEIRPWLSYLKMWYSHIFHVLKVPFSQEKEY